MMLYHFLSDGLRQCAYADILESVPIVISGRDFFLSSNSYFGVAWILSGA